MNNISELRNKINNALREIGNEEVVAIQTAVSVTGSRYIHSNAGEPPRMITGNLRTNINYEVNDLTLIMKSNALYSKPLEDINRPFMSTSFSKMKDTFIQKLKDKIGN